MREKNKGVKPNPNIKEYYESLKPPHKLGEGNYPNSIPANGGRPTSYGLGIDDAFPVGMTPEDFKKLMKDCKPIFKPCFVDVPIITGTKGEGEWSEEEVKVYNELISKDYQILTVTSDSPTVTPIYPEKMFLVYYVVNGIIPVNLFVIESELNAIRYIDKANDVLGRWREYHSTIDKSNVLFEKTKLTESVSGVYYREIEFKKF